MPQEKVRAYYAYYEKIACKYNENCLNEKYYKETNFYNLLRWINIKGMDVLDLGCGTGRFTKYLAGCADKVTGIDFSKEMIRIAQENDAFESYLMKMDELDFRANTFDLVTAVGSLEYHDKIIPVMAEVRRVLKPGGKFYFNIHRDIAHVKLFRKLKSKPRDWEYNLYKEKYIKKILKDLGFVIEYTKSTYFLPMQFNTSKLDTCLSNIPIINKFSAMFVIGATICK